MEYGGELGNKPSLEISFWILRRYSVWPRIMPLIALVLPVDSDMQCEIGAEPLQAKWKYESIVLQA